MSRNVSFVALAALLVAFCLPVRAAEITVRMGASTQDSMPTTIAAKKFCEEIARKTDGRIVIDFYPARQLGDDTELAEQIMDGMLETAVVSTPIFSGYTPLLDSLQIPFLLGTYEKEYKALTSPEMQAIYAGLEEFNIKTLTVFENGIRHLANNVRPINKPEDLQGLKLRVVPSTLILDAVKSIGGNPTPMAYGEVYTALQNKVVDGEEINLTSIASEKHYEVVKYVSKIGFWPFPGALMINLEFFNSLSPEDQRIFQETADECLKYNHEVIAAAETRAMELIAGANGEVNEITDHAPFVEATRHIREQYAKKDPAIAAFIDMAEDL